MTRSIRLEFPGALYHVTARGNAGGAIFFSERDRWMWLRLLDITCRRFDFRVYAYCQMTNHYHVMVETPNGHLGRGIKYLNSCYSQSINRQHERFGHLLQGRYKAILVQKECHLMELCRYLVRNPVRAEMVKDVVEWPWSSYHATVGLANASEWLDTNWILSQFHSDRHCAIAAYKAYVQDGVNSPNPLKAARDRLILGDTSFAEQSRDKLLTRDLSRFTREQRRAASLSLEECAEKYPNRDEAMAQAYKTTNFSMIQIGRFFGVSVTTVARAVNSRN